MPKILKFYKHCKPIVLRFSDFDVIGHMNNSKYQVHLEEARIAYFQDILNQSKQDWHFNSVVSKISIDFIKPIEIGDTVNLFTKCFNFTSKTHEVHNLFVRNNNGKEEIVAKAHTVMAAFDYRTKKPTEFPDQFKIIVEKYEAAGESSSANEAPQKL